MTRHIVVIVEDRNAYYGHHVFASEAEAFAFAEGMEAAWKISHGPANCWRPLALDDPSQRREWEGMGSPGREEVGS